MISLDGMNFCFKILWNLIPSEYKTSFCYRYTYFFLFFLFAHCSHYYRRKFYYSSNLNAICNANKKKIGSKIVIIAWVEEENEDEFYIHNFVTGFHIMLKFFFNNIMNKKYVCCCGSDSHQLLFSLVCFVET